LGVGPGGVEERAEEIENGPLSALRIGSCVHVVSKVPVGSASCFAMLTEC
jgi:hypothetical protein